MKVLATYSIKGGVGKTSAAVNLGALAARDGRRTLVWDLDPQGASTYALRVLPRKHLQVNWLKNPPHLRRIF